jgi:hypothetical protein
MEPLSIAQCSGYPTYWNTSYDKEEHLADHKSFMSSLNILFNKEHDDFSRLYWIPKFHNNPYTGNNTKGAYSFWRHELLINMANILTAVKEGIHSYWNKVYSRSSFNQMWTLQYWILWINVIIRNFVCLSLHFTDHSPRECIKTFQVITNNAVIFKMVRNVAN